jgi:hypothetical protein
MDIHNQKRCFSPIPFSPPPSHSTATDSITASYVDVVADLVRVAAATATTPRVFHSTLLQIRQNVEAINLRTELCPFALISASVLAQGEDVVAQSLTSSAIRVLANSRFDDIEAEAACTAMLGAVCDMPKDYFISDEVSSYINAATKAML